MKRLYTLLFTALLTVCGWHSTAAQSQTVTGTVVDESGVTLPGVTILVKGTSRGVVTDFDGNFSIQASPEDVLVFSFVGYRSQEVTVGSQTEFNIDLQPDISELQEVVVTGYGTQQRRKLTSSIASVTSEELEKLPVASVDQALQGQAAGVQVTKATGAPGGAVSIRIRGTASILGGQEPLYVIDGVPVNNTFNGSPQAGNDVLNGLAGLTPEDIESIEILKDAASASIYGARAANGVVLITTKRGKKGSLNVSLNTYAGVSALSRRYDLLDAGQFQSASNEGLIGIGERPVYTTAPTVNTDWQDEVLQAAPMYSAYVSVRGGSEDSRYMLSANYFDQEGVIINSQFTRYSIRANLDHDIGRRLSVGSSLFFSLTESDRLRNTGNADVQAAFNGNNLYGPSVLSSALVANPSLPIFNLAGNYQVDSLNAVQNPVALAETASLVNETNRLITNVYAEYEFFPFLKFRTNFGADLRVDNENFSFPPPPTGGGGRTQNRTFREFLWLSENYLTFTKSYGPHSLEVLAGASFQQSQNSGLLAEGRQITLADLSNLQVAPDRSITVAGDNSWAMISTFLRVRYDLEGKYLFGATLRTDGSSRFGPNRRYGFFPSAEAGWILSDEAFWDNIPWVTYAKLRTSYGLTGNDQIPPFGWRNTLSPEANAAPVFYLNQIGVLANNIQNENYSWEQTAQFNAALDLSILDNSFEFNIEYYNRQTSNLLFFQELPQTTGFDNRLANIGSMENQGIELALKAGIVREGDFQWRATFNISRNWNKIIELNGDESFVTGSFGYSHIAVPGQPISIQMYQVEEFVDPNFGHWVVKDLDGSGARNLADLSIIGSPLPVHFGGFNNDLSYRNWSLTAFFQWSYGNDILNSTRSFVENTGRSAIARIGTNLTTDALNRWQQEGDQATFPGMDFQNRYGDNATYPLTGHGVPIDRYLEDGSYLRLKNLQLAYNLPSSMAEAAGIKSMQVYATGYNLITITNYSGFDPEVNANITSNVGIGIDNGTFPQSRTYILGLKINL